MLYASFDPLTSTGTNDANPVNNVTSAEFTSSYIELIKEVHRKYPMAQIILLTLWEGFGAVGTVKCDPATSKC